MSHRSGFITILIAACVLSYSCSQRKKEEPPMHEQKNNVSIDSKNDLLPWLDSLERRYELACIQMGTANWNSYSKEAPYDLDAAKAALGKIFLDSAVRGMLDEWLRRSPSLADKPLARRLEMWHRCFIGGAIYADPDIAKRENALQQIITNFQRKLDDKPVTRAEISNLIRQERRQARRQKLWSVESQVSAVAAESLIALVKLRNEKARAFGFPNYYSLVLHLQAIDEQWLLKTLDSLEKQTHEAFASFIATSSMKLHVSEVGPWDFEYALREAVSLPDKYFLSDSVFEILHRFQKGIGFNVDSLSIKEVVKDIPYGGLSLAVNIPSDSRFLVNPTKGKGFYATAFHEYGHSLKAVHTHVEYPILKGYEWIPGAQCAAYEEGVAEMHGEFTDDSLWLATFTNAKPKQIEKYMKGRGLPTLYRLRRLLKDFAIEYAMYKDPNQDMRKVEYEMYERYLLIDLPDSEPHQFAASIWYTSYPCYYQNYILAAMIATQIQEALTNKFGETKSTNHELADFMIKYLYETGEKLEWIERIRNATGKSLEPGAYLRKLGIERSRLLTKE
ncbi:MAG: hypothetical protein HY033_05795 [Ignavibacteriae bacterium]|nr:hypothetical protein [Ignavibacteriota bacterium]